MQMVQLSESYETNDKAYDAAQVYLLMLVSLCM